MSNRDHYSILGVLPDAEDIVITAAYRALAQRYHPDKWRGDPTEAHSRMSDINAAYHVLCDAGRRAEYDRSREKNSRQEFASAENAECAEAFSTALREVEERWQVACSIFPDLSKLRSGLSRISSSLAFAYVTEVLESKDYERRHDLAKHLEQAFLARYFGSDPAVIAFARGLVLSGHKEAAMALNKLVDVMGSSIGSSLLINKIDEDFGFRKAREQAAADQLFRNDRERLVHAVRNLCYYNEARELAELLGYEVTEVGGGIFSSPSVNVKPPNGDSMRFKSSSAFVYWVRDTLCANL